MNANNETIRRLAEATLRKFAESPANGLCPDDCSFGALVDEFAVCLITVWPQVFPETVPPEGSLKVRIYAASIHSDGRTSNGVRCVDTYTDEADCARLLFEDRDTHRGIVEAWLPPVAMAPTVQGTSIAADVEVRDEA